jgi:hypothetical protein
MSATTATAAPTPETAPGGSRRPGHWMLVALVLTAIVAVAAAYTASVLNRDEAPELTAGRPAVLAEADVAAVAERLGHDVYGVPAQAGTRLELTRGSRGEVWVRYLTGDAQPGDRRAQFLAVGTYRQSGALAAAHAAAEGAQSRSAVLPGGGLMLWSLERPTSVYLARPGSDLLVEVYSPDPEQAKGLVRGGAVGPLN